MYLLNGLVKNEEMEQDLSVNEPIRENTEYESTKSWSFLPIYTAFLSLTPTDTLNQVILPCRVFSSIPDLCPLDASGILPYQL